MRNYKVTLVWSGEETIYVEAESDEEARRLAIDNAEGMPVELEWHDSREEILYQFPDEVHEQDVIR